MTCVEKFETQKELNNHFRAAHPPVKCDLCQDHFDTPVAMLWHKYKHYDYMFECNICDKGFQFESHKCEHMRVHQTQGDWVCFKPKWGKQFKRESELNAHLFSHNKVPQKCKHCPYTNSDPVTYKCTCGNIAMRYPSNVVNVAKASNGSSSMLDILNQANVLDPTTKHVFFILQLFCYVLNFRTYM